jgi:bacterioferritin-associated ferredoxin
MKPVFIFAEHVRKILESGKKEIEIPEGVRISAAAYDIIRDNKMRIVEVPADKPADDARAPEAGDEPAVAEAAATDQEESGAAAVEKGTSDDDAGQIPEDVLEDIVERVIGRFRQARGLKPAAAAEPASPAGGGSPETAAGAAPDDDLVICRCEEITRGEIKDAIRNGMQTLNGIKRVTRAGMGLCQGQTCQRLVAQILTEELGLAAADIDPTTARGPVRPLRLEVFANS